MFPLPSLSKAKKVITKDLHGNINGYLVELEKEGRRTTTYLTVAYPGCFKGYHLHTVRESNYVCIRSKAKIILYTKTGRKEFILEAGQKDKLFIPINTPTGLLNEFNEEAWLINFPNPAYDPLLKNEQIDFSQDDIDNNKHLIYYDP